MSAVFVNMSPTYRVSKVLVHKRENRARYVRWWIVSRFFAGRRDNWPAPRLAGVMGLYLTHS